MTLSDEELDKRIGTNIARGRALRKLTQKALADRTGVTYQQVQKYEAAQNRVATSRLIGIAVALELPLNFFIGEIEGLPLSTDLLPQVNETILRTINDFIALSYRDQTIIGGIITSWKKTDEARR